MHIQKDVTFCFSVSGATMPTYMKTITVHTEAELVPVVECVLTMLRERQDNNAGAAVMALHGDLGVGKTTFMQTLARALGVTDYVTSPTFVIMKRYDVDDTVWKTLIHIDAYRVENIDEMRPLRFGELLADKELIIGIEWAEQIASLLPPTTVHLQFALTGGCRTITIS